MSTVTAVSLDAPTASNQGLCIYTCGREHIGTYEPHFVLLSTFQLCVTHQVCPLVGAPRRSQHCNTVLHLFSICTMPLDSSFHRQQQLLQLSVRASVSNTSVLRLRQHDSNCVQSNVNLLLCNSNAAVKCFCQPLARMHDACMHASSRARVA